MSYRFDDAFSVMLFRVMLLGSVLFCSELWAEPKYRIEFDGIDKLPTITLDGEKARIHTQGLFVTEKHFLISGRLEKSPKRSLLVRIERKTNRYEALDITQTIDGIVLDHPGGFDCDPKGNFWIPVSTSHRRGPTRVCGYNIDSRKPLAKAELIGQFEIHDHVGAISCGSDDALITANWDTKVISTYQTDGSKKREIQQEEILFRGDPFIAVQIGSDSWRQEKCRQKRDGRSMGNHGWARQGREKAACHRCYRQYV